MDATEFTEKGRGATLEELDQAIGSPRGPESFERFSDLHYYLVAKSIVEPEEDWESPSRDMSKPTNVRLLPDLPLTAADLERIARAEV